MDTSFRFGKSHWKNFNKEDIQKIDHERRENLKNLRSMDLVKLCRACTKPNNILEDICSACEFPLTTLDIIVQARKNPFLEIIRGNSTEQEEILFNCEDLIVVDAKFGVSKNHVLAVSIEEIPDIKHLKKIHLPLVRKLYEAGKKVLIYRAACSLDNNNRPSEELERYVVCGFNEPVSISHLHLHLALPPFTTTKFLKYPRFHFYEKVLQDIENHGKVLTHQEHPNEEEWKIEYERVIRAIEKFEKLGKS